MNWLGVTGGSTFVLALVRRGSIGQCDLAEDDVHDKGIGSCFLGSRTDFWGVWHLAWVLR